MIDFNCLHCTCSFVPPSHSFFVDGAVYLITLISHFVNPFRTLSTMFDASFIINACVSIEVFVLHLSYQRLVHYDLIIPEYSALQKCLCGLGKRPDQFVSGRLTLFIYLSQLHGSKCLLMFPFPTLWYANNLHDALLISGMPW